MPSPDHFHSAAGQMSAGAVAALLLLTTCTTASPASTENHSQPASSSPVTSIATIVALVALATIAIGALTFYSTKWIRRSQNNRQQLPVTAGKVIVEVSALESPKHKVHSWALVRGNAPVQSGSADLESARSVVSKPSPIAAPAAAVHASPKCRKSEKSTARKVKAHISRSADSAHPAMGRSISLAPVMETSSSSPPGMQKTPSVETYASTPAQSRAYEALRPEPLTPSSVVPSTLIISRVLSRNPPPSSPATPNRRRRPSITTPAGQPLFDHDGVFRVRFSSPQPVSCVSRSPLRGDQNNEDPSGWRYFEVGVEDGVSDETMGVNRWANAGQPPSMSIGLVAKPYPDSVPVGWCRTSIGYASDGKVYASSPSPVSTDLPTYTHTAVIGVGHNPHTGAVFFTHDGKLAYFGAGGPADSIDMGLEDSELRSGTPQRELYAAIFSSGVSVVQVNYGGRPFAFDFRKAVAEWRRAAAEEEVESDGETA
ncbi:hypothetical protein BJ742DRAFT_292319 [Cladochytrium replicatum]|nr:hypothetical protein BJ742DRAFT_292319 [Cladochytrium replicatum]